MARVIRRRRKKSNWKSLSSRRYEKLCPRFLDLAIIANTNYRQIWKKPSEHEKKRYHVVDKKLEIKLEKTIFSYHNNWLFNKEF